MIKLYEIKITNPNSEDIKDFQVKVSISDKDLFSVFNDISKFCVIDRLKNYLDFYIQELNTETGDMLLWIKAPYIPSGWSYVCYLCYDETQQNTLSNPYNTFDFYDGFEVWEGWIKHGYGIVEQSSEEVYKGKYSLKKTGYNDPNGGYKYIGFTLDYPFILECYIYRANFNGGGADRIGIIDSNGNGYGICLGHKTSTTPTELGYDERDNYAGNFTKLNTLSEDPYHVWYHVKFVWDNGQIICEVDWDKYRYSSQANNSKYNKFEYVYVFGGHDYFVDEMFIRKYAQEDPIVSINRIAKKVAIDVYDIQGIPIDEFYYSINGNNWIKASTPLVIYLDGKAEFTIGKPLFDKVVLSIDPNIRTEYNVVLTPYLHQPITMMRKINTNNWELKNGELIIYDDDSITPLLVFRLLDKEGNPTDYNVYKRIRTK